MHKNTSRVLSPHLQVYRFPLAVLMSIFHRLTGIILFVVSVIVPWYYYFYYFQAYGFFQSIVAKALSISPIVNTSVFVLVSFSLCFHTVSGVRHIFWDMSMFSSVPAIKTSNLVVIFCSILMTVFVFFNCE